MVTTVDARAQPELPALRLLARTGATAAVDPGPSLAACDPAALARVLGDQRLVALLGTRAIALWDGADAPPSFVETVEAAVAANRSRGLALEALSAEFVASLEEAGIPALVLKGPLQARRLHGDIGFRSSNDIDLLVSRAHLAPAATVLTKFGYAVDPATPLRSHGLPDIHSILRSRAAGLPRIDLHWRVHWYEDRFSDQLLANSRKRGAFLEPEPRDDLAALMLFHARDGFYGLRGAVDIAAWRDLHGADGGPALEQHWCEHPRLQRAWGAAAMATERVVGVSADELVPAREPGFKVALAVKLANWNQVGDPDQLRANIAIVDALLSPIDELPRFLRREVFVTPVEVQSMYGLLPSERWRTTAMRIAHIAKVTLRYLAGLWSAIRSPVSTRFGG